MNIFSWSEKMWIGVAADFEDFTSSNRKRISAVLSAREKKTIIIVLTAKSIDFSK